MSSSKITDVCVLIVLAGGACAMGGEELLVNSCDGAEEWTLHLGTEYFGATGTRRDTDDPERGACLRVDFDFSEGGRYTGAKWRGAVSAGDRLAFWIQLSGAGWGTVRVRDARGQWHLANFHVPAGKWQRVELPFSKDTFTARWGGPKDGKFYLPLREVFIGANKSASAAKGYCLIDDVSVIVDEPKQEDTWELVLKPSAPSGVAFPGEEAACDVVVINRVRRARRAGVSLSIDTEEGKKAEHQWAVEASGWGAAERTVVLPTDDCGYQALRAVLVVGEQTVAQTRSALAVVPRPVSYRQRDPQCFFGVMSICDYEAADRIGCKNVRPQAYWGSVERPKDNYLWGRTDYIMDECQRHGISVVITLRPEARPGWAGWKTLQELVAKEEHLRQVRDWAHDLTVHYQGRLAGVEILNEPDGTCWRHYGVPLATGIDISAKLTQAGAAGVRAADPEMPVLGLSVAGMDFTRGLEVTRGVLAKAGPSFDIFAGHPYSHVRYMGMGRRAETPEESRVPEKLRAALKALADHGRPQRIWSTELGWAINPLEPLMSDVSIEFAAYVARSFILAKTVERVEKLYWFNMRNSGERGYNYGLFQGKPESMPPHYPLPAASSYAACARMLHHTKCVRQIEIGPTVRAWRFDSAEHRRSIVALWSTGEKLRLRARVPTETEATNSFSQLVAKETDLDVVLSVLPVYLTTPLGEAEALEEQLSRATLDAENPVTLGAAHVVSLGTMILDLTNHANRAVPCEIHVRAVRRRQAAKLEPGLNRVKFALGRYMIEHRPGELDITVAAQGTVLKRVLPVRLRSLAYLPNVQIDGRFDETHSLAAVQLDDHKYVLPPDPTLGWSGPDNLSVKAWLGWNADVLYFAAQVTDDRHHAPFESENNFWNSDGIQLAIDPWNDSTVGFDEDDREVGFVLTATGPRAFLTAPKPHRVLRCDLHSARTGSVTSYEAAIPWLVLGQKPPRAHRVMAINFIVNENDGHGRAYWMGLTPGIGSGKSPKQYEEFLLVGRP